MEARYINPYTDFGFKKLFGEEASKDLLKDFLNQLLPEQHQIVSLTFQPSNRLAEAATARAAVFDIYCQGANGDRFIVEMQKAKQDYFKDRTVFYATFPIRDQAIRGDWDFKLKAVYCVGILDFEFDPEEGKPHVLTTVKLKDQDDQVFYDKLTFIYLQMPLFTKTESELTTHFEKWLYFLKHLSDLDEIPNILREPLFERGFHIAELACYTPDERWDYERSLKIHRDLKNVIDYANRKGREEGREEGIEAGIRQAYDRMLASGMTPTAAKQILGL